MTSIREALRRLMQRERERPASEFSYAIYWTKVVRGWDAARRLHALEGAERTLTGPGFVSNEFSRRFSVPEIDGSAHSGDSLLALRKVLKAFEESSG
jgi:hypothetical protein